MPRKLSKKRVQMNNTKGGAKSYRKIKSRKLKRGGAGADAAPPPAEEERPRAQVAIAGEGAPPPVVAGAGGADAAAPPPVEGAGGADAGGEESGEAPLDAAKATTGFFRTVKNVLKRKPTPTPDENLKDAIKIIFDVLKQKIPNTLGLIENAMIAMQDFVLTGDAKTQYETLTRIYPGILQDLGGDDDEEEEGEGGEDVDGGLEI